MLDLWESSRQGQENESPQRCKGIWQKKSINLDQAARSGPEALTNLPVLHLSNRKRSRSLASWRPQPGSMRHQGHILCLPIDSSSLPTKPSPAFPSSDPVCSLCLLWGCAVQARHTTPSHVTHLNPTHGDQTVVQGQNTILCKADPHEKVLDLCLETSLSTLGMFVPMTHGWLRVVLDHSISTVSGVLSLCLSSISVSFSPFVSCSGKK